MPTDNVTIKGSWLRANTFAIGSEMSGGVSNVRFVDSVISDSEGSGTYILRVKSKAGRGGYVKDILTHNVHAPSLKTNGRPAFAFSVNAEYLGGSTGPVADFTNFTFRNVSAGSADYAGEFVGGNSTHMLKGISMNNVHINATKGSWRCSNVDNATVEVSHTVPAFEAKSRCIPAVRDG